jgi:hypothetical protein
MFESHFQMQATAALSLQVDKVSGDQAEAQRSRKQNQKKWVLGHPPFLALLICAILNLEFIQVVVL